MQAVRLRARSCRCGGTRRGEPHRGGGRAPHRGLSGPQRLLRSRCPVSRDADAPGTRQGQGHRHSLGLGVRHCRRTTALSGGVVLRPGLRPAPGSGRGERMHQQRENIGGYCQTGLSPKSARIRRSPRKHALAGQKKTNPEGLVFTVWWSWRDLNPRPSTFLVQIYMFSVLIWISPLASCRRTLRNRPVPYCLILSQGTRAKTSRCDYLHSREVLRPPCPAHRPAVVKLTGN